MRAPEERSSRVQAVKAKLGSWPVGGAFEPSCFLIALCSSMIMQQAIKHVPPSKWQVAAGMPRLDPQGRTTLRLRSENHCQGLACARGYKYRPSLISSLESSRFGARSRSLVSVPSTRAGFFPPGTGGHKLVETSAPQPPLWFSILFPSPSLLHSPSVLGIRPSRTVSPSRAKAKARKGRRASKAQTQVRARNLQDVRFRLNSRACLEPRTVLGFVSTSTWRMAARWRAKTSTATQLA